MSDLTVKEFLEAVHRSGLIESGHLLEALVESKKTGGLPKTAEETAAFLCQQGLLTTWQTKNLLSGKSRGFFLRNYRLLDHLGTGGMSSVFLARHGLLTRLVAIKVLPIARSKDQSYLDHFLLEARATASLSHPHIVRVYDIDEEAGTHFMVMEYVPGRDLRKLVKEQGRAELESTAHYIAQAAAGLQHAHERGLVHRDVKPANLVVNDRGIVKILDLGLAYSDDRELSTLTTTHASSMLGTADYVSPEQAQHPHRIDHRADIYSLGCTMYYLLAGQPPFPTGTISERIEQHRSEIPRDIRALREDCPHSLGSVCMTMLAKSPEARFASAGMVASQLCQWLVCREYPLAPSLVPMTNFNY